MIQYTKQKCQNSIWTTTVFLCFCLATFGGVQAQQAVTSASLSGRVEDINGSVLRGVTLSTTNLETNQKQVATSDAEGRFRFPHLPVGPYQFYATAQGFAPVTKELTMTVGQALDLPLRLELAGVSARVTVTDVPVIETVRTQVTETIRPADIVNLPCQPRHSQ